MFEDWGRGIGRDENGRRGEEEERSMEEERKKTIQKGAG